MFFENPADFNIFTNLKKIIVNSAQFDEKSARDSERLASIVHSNFIFLLTGSVKRKQLYFEKKLE